MSDTLTREWLEADGLGGFASGTVAGIRTRRYHALLLTARTPPTGRVVLVNGFDAWVETPAGRFAISSQVYGPEVTSPDGASRVAEFTVEPWPRWTFAMPDGTRVSQEILVPKDASAVAVSWKLLSGAGAVTLEVRPFLSGRDYHSLHHENPDFRFDAETAPDGLLRFRPYAAMPAIAMRANGAYVHRPDWYRNFLYAEESARGLDFSEDLASPGNLRFDLSRGEGIWLMAAEGHESALGTGGAEAALEVIRSSERARRAAFTDRLDRAADVYLVRRGSGKTVVAGYPWFTDWGRDTFIALRGLCLATGRLEEAGSILGEWAGAVSEGMLPNLFPDGKVQPEFNSVDASLWYLVAVHEYFAARAASGRRVTGDERKNLQDAFGAILSGYARGTRYGIRADADGLLAAGEPGVQLTWMDAKVGDWVVTPRIGKPVEVQALWINALKIADRFSDVRELLAKATESFERRFWNEAEGCLYDVVDPDHRPGTADATFRPNQIFAVGGLPFPLLQGERARRVVDAVEARLLTPLGLRTLPPEHPDYHGRYEGGVRERDGAYHQGTVWPYLQGAFADAWVRVRGGGAAVFREARDRFLAPLQAHLDEAGLGHVSEIADGDAPHTPRGCPFQAWSVGEMLRLDRVILAPAPTVRRKPQRETGRRKAETSRARA
jgi:predicted glycogen debranching enzyme